MITASPRLLTYSECAERLHVSPSTAQRYGRTGRLEVIRLTERTHRISETELEAFLQRSSHARTPQETS